MAGAATSGLSGHKWPRLALSSLCCGASLGSFGAFSLRRVDAAPRERSDATQLTSPRGEPDAKAPPVVQRRTARRSDEHPLDVAHDSLSAAAPPPPLLSHTEPLLSLLPTSWERVPSRSRPGTYSYLHVPTGHKQSRHPADDDDATLKVYKSTKEGRDSLPRKRGKEESAGPASKNQHIESSTEIEQHEPTLAAMAVARVPTEEVTDTATDTTSTAMLMTGGDCITCAPQGSEGSLSPPMEDSN